MLRKRLKAADGPLSGADFSIADRTLLGRAGDNEIQLLTRGVSRHHAVITCERDTATLRDLSSHNGTFVNGKRISQQVLSVGDRVRIDTHEFVYELSGDPLPAEPEEQVSVLSGPAEEITRLMDTPPELLAQRTTWSPANDD